jgi:N-acetylneuraminate synthase
MNHLKIIAEIGCNHKGSMDIAREMIMTAATYCKVDVVKFQKRNNKELLSEDEYNAPHPNPGNSYGDTYGSHREFLEFTVEQHRQLKKWCEELGVGYSTSVWDITSAKEICALNPSLIKIPSACNLNRKLLAYLCEHFEGEIHLSLGMTSKEEEEMIISFFESEGRNNDLVIYSCTSGYPVPFEDVCLLEISRLREQFSHRVKAIGFSGHHLGIAVDTAAVVLGAEWIERHYTLDRTWKGTDHAASLEPEGLRKLVRDCKAVSAALQHKKEDILDIESVQRNKLKRNQIRWEK